MTFLALLSSRRLLEEFLRTGDRPAAVLARNRAVAEAARAHQLPTLHVDELWTRAERVALQDHVDDLTRALAGDIPPTDAGYGRWGWWALEYAFAISLSHGARTRRLLEAGRALAPGASAVVHDGDGFAQGAIISLAAAETGLTVAGFPPQDGDALHTAQDMLLTPLFKEGAREDWRGRPLAADRRLTVVAFHANEIAQCFGPLQASADLRLAMDQRDPWPVPGPVLEADPIGPDHPLLAPEWPAARGAAAASWEREICQHLFVTYQPWLREGLAWSTAAYRAGGVRALLAAQDFLPHMRTRMLACRRLGIPSILLQHGAYHAHRTGGRGDRNHTVAEHTLTWSRAVNRELAEWGLERPTTVVGWPQGTTPLAREARARRRSGSGVRPWVVLSTGSSSDSAELPYDQGQRFLSEVLPALREAHPHDPIVLKGHPFYDNADRLAALCRSLGVDDVTIQVDKVSMWEVVAGARGVIGTKSTSAFSAAALGVPVVIYYPFEDDAWFDRYRDTPVARTPGELLVLLQLPLSQWGGGGSTGPSVREQFRIDVDAARRLLARVRRLARGRAGASGISRRTDTGRQKSSPRLSPHREPGVAVS